MWARAEVSADAVVDAVVPAAEAAGIAIDPAHVFEDMGPDRPLGALAESLRGRDRPTGLFVWSDDVAFECMHEIRAAGLQIPKDISIVGFDSTGSFTK